jgi:hypothetical protein
MPAPTRAPIPSEHSGHVDVNGINIYYATYGEGPPVILLQGGLADADYWAIRSRRWRRITPSS